MHQCRVCGRDFDPLGFQVVVPGFGEGFDRVACALQAHRLGPAAATPGVEPSAAPILSVVRPFPAALAAGPLMLEPNPFRRPVLGTYLAVLAAGTAATVYLWMRVFAPEMSSLQLPFPTAEAVGSQSVPAQIFAAPRPPAAADASEPAAGAGAGAGTADAGAVAGAFVSAPAPATASPGSAVDGPTAPRQPTAGGDLPRTRPSDDGPGTPDGDGRANPKPAESKPGKEKSHGRPDHAGPPPHATAPPRPPRPAPPPARPRNAGPPAHAGRPSRPGPPAHAQGRRDPPGKAKGRGKKH